MRKFAPQLTAATTTTAVSLAANGRCLSSTPPNSSELSSSTHSHTITEGVPHLSNTAGLDASAMRAFVSTFAKSFADEASAHAKSTRREFRGWARRLTGSSSSARIQRNTKITMKTESLLVPPAELIARIAAVRSLGIRAPKPGGGTESVEPKKETGGPSPTEQKPSSEGGDKPKAPTTDKKENKVDSKKKEDGKKGSGGGNNEDGDEKDDDLDLEPDTITPMVTKFVLGVFVLSAVLYYFSKPSGRLSSWEAVMERTDALVRVDIYHEYAEFHFAEGPTLHVGLLHDDNHTEVKLKEVLSKCALADNFNTNWIGESFSESMLHFVGVFAWIVPFVFFPSFVLILTRAIGTAMSGVQEGKNKVTSKVMFRVQKGSKTRFNDIAGMTEAKQEVMEIVDFLKHPERYTKLGAKVPTGALLLGPPGTGKTLLAKAVAGEAGVAFIPCIGSDFVELYVGMGALRVRQLFELAKKQRCIIYIDEIDAIGLKRSGAGHGEKQEQEHTLNELLTQLDGFGSSRGDVMILASSNVAQSELDPALIRPGRFDRLVNVDAPVIKERIDIFKVHLSKLRLVAPPETNAPETTATAATTAEQTANTSEKAADKIAAILDEKQTDDSAKAVPIPTAPAPEAAAPKAETKSEEPPTTNTSAAAIDTSKDEIEPADPTKKYAVLTKREKEEDTFITTEEEEEMRTNKFKDISHKKMEEAAIRAMDEKLSQLPAGVRPLVEAYAVRMSDLCPGFVGADIMNVCNEAAILAAREDCKFVSINHLERSIDRVLAGIEHRSRVLSAFEKKVVAYHEAGHAVAGWFLGRADPLMKVSIVPRGGSALGYAQYLPNENHLRTSNEIKDSICVTLGGRVAERIFFDHLSTGASDDLRKVTKMAYMHVSSFNTTTAHHAPGTRNTRYVKPFGAAISDKIDVAAKKLVDDMFQRTLELLTEKKKEMEVLAEHLLKHEVLTHADVVNYLGARPPRPSDVRKYHIEEAKAAQQ